MRFMVPYRTKEAAYGMGTTRWEAILKVMVPTAAGGIASAMVLGFGRALGETMALAMLIGNSNQINLSLFAPAQTLASLLASHFPEAGQTEVQADRKSTRLNSSHLVISYAVFCL